jgi:AcrR family transcriptional regulator
MSPTVNRGRAAAADNRQALLDAARRVLADGGLNAPLVAVARTAGVGQGSLYRHFPDRVDLALAVFDDNVREIEALAVEPSTTLDDLLALLTRRAIESVAFVDMITADTADPRLIDIARRVEAAIATKLPPAQRAGRLNPDLEASDVALAIGMVSSLVAKTPLGERDARARHAWSLLRSGLAANH